MTLACLNIPVEELEKEDLKRIFYLYKVNFSFNYDILERSKNNLKQPVEIFCGKESELKSFDSLPFLKWIHIADPFIDDIQLKYECAKRNILLTHSRTQEGLHIAEYALTWADFFMKGLDQVLFNSWEELELPQVISNKRFLQIGVGKVGSEIAKRAQQQGYRVWGVRKKSHSFHPYCEKTFSLDHLHSLLANSDVICCSLVKDSLKQEIFQQATLRHVKKGAIMIFLSNCESVNMPALKKILEEKHLRGVVIDTDKKAYLEYKDLPGLFLSPARAPLPSLSTQKALPIFKRNLWHFLHGNFEGMENLA